jgi:hypothetical protein
MIPFPRTARLLPAGASDGIGRRIFRGGDGEQTHSMQRLRRRLIAAARPIARRR